MKLTRTTAGLIACIGLLTACTGKEVDGSATVAPATTAPTTITGKDATPPDMSAPQSVPDTTMQQLSLAGVICAVGAEDPTHLTAVVVNDGKGSYVSLPYVQDLTDQFRIGLRVSASAGSDGNGELRTSEALSADGVKDACKGKDSTPLSDLKIIQEHTDGLRICGMAYEKDRITVLTLEGNVPVSYAEVNGLAIGRKIPFAGDGDRVVPNGPGQFFDLKECFDESGLMVTTADQPA